MKHAAASFLAALLLGLGVPAFGATFSVNTTADTHDAAAGNGVCADGAGQCSLRAALEEANALAGTHTVNLPPGTYLLAPSFGELAVAPNGNKTLTVNGTSAPANTTVQATNSGCPAAVTCNNRVFDIDSSLTGNANVTIQNVTIKGGRNNDALGGAGIISGCETPDCPSGADTTTLSNVVLVDNVVSGGGSVGVGGGIQHIGGNLTLTNVTLDSNSSGTAAGGGVYYDTHVPSTGTLTISDSVFLNNVAGGSSSGGGGLAIAGVGTGTITRGLFSGNTANGSGSQAGGGAIYTSGLNLTITKSTFVSNQQLGTGQGGAVFQNSGVVTISFSRFALNNAAGAGDVLSRNTVAPTGSLTADNNWWSRNSGPTAAEQSGAFTVGSWLQLRHVASPGTIFIGESTGLTADIFGRNSGGPVAPASLTGLASFPNPAGTVFGNPVRGTISGAGTQFVNGVTTATFNSNAAGAGSADATADAQTVTASITIQKGDTTTVIISDTPDPTVTGQSFTVTYGIAVVAPASGIPAGNVTVSDGVDSCTATAAAGACTLALTTAGARTLVATYGGDSNFNPSSSSGAPHTVNKADTTTTILSDNPDPSVVGQGVTVTYNVAVTAPGGGSPGGNVTVSDGTDSCTATAAAGSCTITFTSAGAKTLVATYAGNANYNGSASAGAAHTVNKANTTTTITADTPDPSVRGAAVAVSYTVTANAPGAGTPTGNVTVSDGVDSCTGTVAAGGCSLTLSTLGARTLTATYAGDSNYNGSTSAGEPHTVNKPDTTTTITSDAPDPSVVGQTVAVSYSVSVNPPGSGTPAGNVTVSDGVDSCTATVAAGGCSLALTTVGARTLTATYAGDANFNGSTSAAASHTVDKASTATTITADTPDPSVVGQLVSVSYSVTVNAPGAGTATGNVTVSDGVSSCTGTVAAGGCSITLTSAGAKTLVATYAGDASFNGSTSAGAAHTVNKANTITTITADAPDPSTTGQAVTVSYTVAATAPGAGTPTGNVTVSDGVDSCTGTVAAGGCTISLSTVGARTLVATYAGDSDFGGSASAGEPHVVNKPATTTTITADTPDPSVVGEAVSVTYTVTVNPPGSGTPTGNVTVSDGVDSCSAAVAAGGCSIVLTTAGARTLVATYAGDANVSGSTSAGAPHTVNKADTTTSLNSDTPDPSVVGQPVTVTYAVNVNAPGSGTPSGTVTVSDGTDSCTGTVAAGSCAVTFTSAGAKTLVASYAGDANFNGSASAGAAHTVNKANTTTTITADTPDPSVVSQPVTVNYTVTPTAPGAGTPAGNVTVSDGVDSCTGTVAAGGCTIAFTSTGAKTLTATYAGDGNFNGSTSAGAAHTVNAANATVSVVSSANPSTFGQPVTFTATVTAAAPASGTPTGTVQFKVDGANLGAPVALSGGTATSTIATPTVAGSPHTVDAVYSGDANFNTNTGTLAGGQTVNKANTTTGVFSPNPTTVFGEPVTFLATVTTVAPGAGTATGSVTFLDNGSPIGTAPLNGFGQATLTTSSLVVGSHPITAAYGGDGNFNASSSAVLTQGVSKANTTTGLSSSANPSAQGQSVTFTATVTAIAPSTGVPTGSVTFSVDGTGVSTTALDGTGQATFSTSTLSAGLHTIDAVYTGDTNFNGSSNTLLQTVQPAADLAITKDDGVTSVAPGGTTTYLIDVSNAGPSPTTGATVSDVLPAEISTASWTCATVSGGATCAASGSGDIADTVNLPVGGAVRYTLVANVDPATTSASMTNTATVAPPAGVADPTPGNATASDTDTLSQKLAVNGDFDGDGKSDLLYVNYSTGEVREWLMNGLTLRQAVIVGRITRKTDRIVGTGDYDGDGKADILWWDRIGLQAYLWLNGSATPTPLPATPFVGARIVASGDYDGNGTSDILWHNVATGQTAIWLMSGGTVSSSGSPGPATRSWRVFGSGDHDGDRKSDILWRDSATGKTTVWFMNGLARRVATATTKNILSLQFKIQGTGDYDGDGKADVLWRNDLTAARQEWRMDSATVAEVGVPGKGVAAPPRIVGLGDYDGDGKADIAWQTPGTGRVTLWLMNKFTIVTKGTITGNPLAPGSGWQIIRLP
jgi:CSLREA domain-containing protein/uncharacterized repeat protein (TIGR01451 family)